MGNRPGVNRFALRLTPRGRPLIILPKNIEKHIIFT